MSRTYDQVDDESEQPDLVVEDPEGYARAQQLRAVFRARDQFLRVRRRVKHNTPSRQDVPLDGVSDIFTAVQEMVLAVEPLLVATGEHERLLSQEAFTIANAGREQQIPSFERSRSIASAHARRRFDNLLGVQDDQGRVDPDALPLAERRALRMTAARKRGVFDGVTIRGIRPFGTRDLKVAVPYRSHWRRQAPPVETSVEIFSRCQQAMSDLGLGFDIEEEEHASKVDDDLLEEVADWRRENL